MKVIVEKQKKCLICCTEIKHRKDGCIYIECLKCGRRIVENTDISKVRMSWVTGKTDMVKSFSIPKQ